MASRYIAGLKKPPKQPMHNPPAAVKVSRQALVGAALREENQYNFLLRIVDDVIIAIRKYVPSLDYLQGGNVVQDLTRRGQFKSREELERFAFKRPGYQQRLINIKKNGYEVGTRIVKGIEQPIIRHPTKKEMNDAVRFAVHELEYIRQQSIAEDPSQGINTSGKLLKPSVFNYESLGFTQTKSERPLMTKHQQWRERLIEQMFTNKFEEQLAKKKSK